MKNLLLHLPLTVSLRVCEANALSQRRAGFRKNFSHFSQTTVTTGCFAQNRKTRKRKKNKKSAQPFFFKTQTLDVYT